MKIQETITDGGLRVISCQIPSSKKVRLELAAGVGSAYDPPNQQGLYHFFEHTAFKGTSRRAREHIESFRKRNLLAWGASTGRIETEYRGESVYKKLPQLCDFLCDIYFHSVFPGEEVEREKEVIRNEIARDNDNDHYIAYFALWKNLWRHNPLRIFGVGTPEGITNVTRDHLLEAKHQWYCPQNTTAFILGKVNHAEAVQEIERHLPKNQASLIIHHSWDDEYVTLPFENELTIERPKREKAILLFGCKFPRYRDERTERVINFLEHLLVKGSGSLLWRELRENRGLAYALSGGTAGEYDLGYYFYISIETMPSRIQEVRELVTQYIFTPLQNKTLHEEVREWFGDWFTIQLDYEQNLNEWANFISSTLKKKKPLKSIERFFERQGKIIQKISLDEVEELRQKTLTPERFVTVIVKPS